jgi:hypothetical protein
MRLSPVYLYLAGSALLLSGCGTSNHIGCSGTDACVEQSFVYATTNAGQVLIFPMAQNGTLSTQALSPVLLLRAVVSRSRHRRMSFSSAIMF